MIRQNDVRTMEAEDMMFVLHNGAREINLDAYGNMWELARQRAEYESIAGFVDDECVGVGGIEPLWEGVGEAWLMLSTNVALYPQRTYLVIREGLQRLIDEGGYIRIQSWVRADFAKAQSLMKHLGFEAEGVAKKYNPDGSDSILYSLIRERG